MAYFNHAYCKTFWAGGNTGYINNAGDDSVDLYGTYGTGAITFANHNVAGWPSVAVAPTGGQSLTLLATSLYQNDKVGKSHGGYQETTKSKTINPKYVTEIWRVDAAAPVTNIIGVGGTPNLASSIGDCCPVFYCNETYGVRFDLKGSPVLRMLNHNAYEVACAYTGCCDGPVPELVDPALVMSSFVEHIANDPIFSGVTNLPGFDNSSDERLVNVGMTVTCDDGETWDLYLPDNRQSGIAGVYFEADGTTLTAAGTAFAAAVGGTVEGTVATFLLDDGGTGYADATDVAVTSDLDGEGVIIDFTQTGGVIDSVTIVNPGVGYQVGEEISIPGGDGLAVLQVTAIADLTFGSVLPLSTYVSTFTPETPNCCAGLVMESAFVETTFGDCTFEPTDHFEIEPLKLQASMVDETGDPCVFEQLCISDGITPSGSGSQTIYPAMQTGKQAMGTGEQVLRDLILSEGYQQNHFSTHRDNRLREITQGYDVTNAVDRTALYTCYYIKHIVPRPYNPSGTFDADAYLLKIPMTAVDSDFEDFVTEWLDNAGNPVGGAGFLTF